MQITRLLGILCLVLAGLLIFYAIQQANLTGSFISEPQWSDSTTMYYLTADNAVILDLQTLFSNPSPAIFSVEEIPELAATIIDDKMFVSANEGASGSYSLTVSVSDGENTTLQLLTFFVDTSSPAEDPSFTQEAPPAEAPPLDQPATAPEENAATTSEPTFGLGYFLPSVITSCVNVSSSETLGNDISSQFTCINITGNNTVLDCNGYKIQYAQGSAGYNGVRAVNIENLTIRNCVFISMNNTGSNPAIYVANTNNTVIENVTILGNGSTPNYGIHITTRSRNYLIENNTIYSNGTGSNNYGVYVDGAVGIISNITIRNNTILTNGTTGAHAIAAQIANTLTITNNTLRTNGSGGSSNGIYFTSATNDTTISNNVITAGLSGGTNNVAVYISTSNRINITNNTAIANATTSYIIRADASRNFTIINNSIRPYRGGVSAIVGIYIDSTSVNGTAHNNTIVINGTDSIFGIRSGASDSFITNNSIHLNTTAGSSAGVYIELGASRTNITGNMMEIINASGAVFTTSTTTGNVLSNNSINISGSVGSIFGVQATGLSTRNNITNNNIRIYYGVTTTGIRLESTNHHMYIYNNTIIVNSTTSANRGIGTGFFTSFNNITILNNSVFVNGTLSNYGLHFDSQFTNGTINKNVIYASGTGVSNYGIYGTSTTQFQNNNNISNNTIVTNGTGTDYGMFFESQFQNNTVTNNVITASSNASGTKNYGIYLLKTTGQPNLQNNFTNNTIFTYGNHSYGIAVEGPLVTSNLFNYTRITANGTTAFAIALTRGNNTFENTYLNYHNFWINQSNVTSQTQNNFTNTTFDFAENGSIRFPLNFSIIGLQNITLRNMNMSFNNSFINSTNISFLNTSAQVTLKGLALTDPFPIVSNNSFYPFSVCLVPECVQVSYSGGAFIFNVNHWSNFSSMETAPPTITGINLNSTDPSTNDTLQNLTLYFNISNGTAGPPTWNITDWRLNGTSIMFFNYPFETNVSSITTVLRDYSTSGVNATLGFGSSAAAPVWNLSGQVGAGYTFDGSDDQINISDTRNPTAYSIEVWVNPDVTTSQSIFVRTAASPATSWSHQLRILTGRFEHYTYDGSSLNITGTTAISAGTWYHVVGTASNSDVMKLYVNGAQEGNNVSLGTLWTGGNQYRVGSSSGGGFGFFDGTIGEVRMYNRSLSAAEIYQLYQEGLAMRHPIILNNEETGITDNWSVSLTPNDHLIEGSTTLSNNVTILAEVPPTPVAYCPITINSSSILVSDINSTTTCVTFGASNIRLDCDGYTITFDTGGGGSDYGVYASGRTNVHTVNCIINDATSTGNSSNPVRYSTTSNSAIRNNTLRSNGTNENHGILTTISSDRNNITSNIIDVNGTGIDNYGMYIIANNQSVINNSILTRGINSSYGIRLTTAANNSIINNTILVNGTGDNNNGIQFDTTSPANSLYNNTINTYGAMNNIGLVFSTASNNFFTLTNITTRGYNSYAISITGSDNMEFNHSYMNATQWITSTAGTYNFTNTTFATGNGSIQFPGFFNITGALSLTQDELNISFNGSFVDAYSFPQLNTSAQLNSSRITLRNLPFVDVHVVQDLEDDGTFVNCPVANCTEISYSAGTFIFDVNHWTNYSSMVNLSCPLYVNETSTLSINHTCPATAVVINASNLVFTCTNNATITYNTGGASSSYGINITGKRNVTIENCIVIDGNSSGASGIGIQLGDSSNILLYNNSIWTNGTNDNYGIQLTDSSSNNTIANNTVNTTGTSASNLGIAINALTTAINNTIENNSVYTNGTTDNRGIAINNARHNRVNNNTIMTFGTTTNNWGIATSAGFNNSITNNSIITNGTLNNDGIRLDSDSTYLILNNTIYARGTGGNRGIRITGTPSTIIANNTISINGSGSNIGIDMLWFVVGTSNTTVEDNRISTNGTSTNNFGIRIDSSINNKFTRNNITTDGTSGSLGIDVLDSVGIGVSNNTFNHTIIKTYGTDAYGYLSFGALSIFENTIFNNTAQWISSASFSTDSTNFTNTTFMNENGSIRIYANATVPGLETVTKAKLNIFFNASYLNGTNLTYFNTTAQITLNNITFIDPKPVVDFNDTGLYIDCPITNCTEVSYSGGVYVYNVTHFTNYSSGEDSSLDIRVVDGEYLANVTPAQAAICTFQTDNLSAAIGCTVVDSGSNGTALSLINNGTSAFGLNVSAVGCPFDSGCVQQMKVNGTAGLPMNSSCNPALNFVTVPNTGTEVNLHKYVPAGEQVFISLNYTFGISGTPEGFKNISYNFTAVTTAPGYDPTC